MVDRTSPTPPSDIARERGRRRFWRTPRFAGAGTVVALALAGVAGTACAEEASVTHVVANAWQSSDFHDAANPGCSIGGSSSVLGGRLVMGASQRRPDPVSLVIRKTGWAIPAGAQVQVRAGFPDGSSMDFTGRGNGQVVEIDLGAEQLRTWVHSLTASPNMKILFGGSEPPWTFDLTGTSKVVNAMSDCFVAHHIVGVAPPFSGMVSVTQPYGGSLDGGPQNPYPSPNAPAPVPTYQPPPAAQLPAPSAKPTQPTSTVELPSSGGSSCKEDWRLCKDNADLVNNYKDYSDAQFSCERAANKKAKFGTPVWPGFWSGGSFGRFHRGTDYVSTGVVVAVEPDAQFQNQFGAMVHSTAQCEYDLKTKSVVTVNVVPND